MAVSKDGHEELFWKFCQAYLDGKDCKQTTSKTVTAEKAQKIKDVLNGVERNDVSSSFKFWVTKTKKFELLHYPELQLKDVLCLPAKQKVRNDKLVECLFSEVLTSCMLFTHTE